MAKDLFIPREKWALNKFKSWDEDYNQTKKSMNEELANQLEGNSLSETELKARVTEAVSKNRTMDCGLKVVKEKVAFVW